MELRTDYSNVSFQNNGKLKLLIIVGTRPEIIRLAAVINKTRQYFDVILAHTGQNYDYNLNGVFFKDLKLKDPEVYMDAVGDDLGATCGNIINASYKLMVATKPDAVLVLGDTNSCLSVIGAKRLHMNVFQRRQIVVLSILFLTLILRTQSMRADTLQNVDFHLNVHMSQVHQWQRCFMKISRRLRQVIFTSVLVWKKENTFFFLPTERKISTQKRTFSVFSMLSMLWQRSTICQSSIVVIHVAAIVSQPQLSN